MPVSVLYLVLQIPFTCTEYAVGSFDQRYVRAFAGKTVVCAGARTLHLVFYLSFILSLAKGETVPFLWVWFRLLLYD